eukprot:s3689_g2.t1
MFSTQVKVGSEAGVKFVKYVPPDHVSATVRKPCSVEGEALDPSINEWYLFHGSRPEALANILVSNFRLTLAGSGATWKEGRALFKRCRQSLGNAPADEYAAQVKAGDPLPVSPDGRELFCVLLCRVVGGRTNLVTTNEIEREKLRSDVFDGPYHSVFGDRVSSLGKPYKEVVVYDKDIPIFQIQVQVHPAMAQKPPVSLPLLPLSLHPTRSTAVWAVGRFLFAYDLQLGTWQVRRRELHGEAELV